MQISSAFRGSDQLWLSCNAVFFDYLCGWSITANRSSEKAHWVNCSLLLSTYFLEKNFMRKSCGFFTTQSQLWLNIRLFVILTKRHPPNLETNKRRHLMLDFSVLKLSFERGRQYQTIMVECIHWIAATMWMILRSSHVCPFRMLLANYSFEEFTSPERMLTISAKRYLETR